MNQLYWDEGLAQSAAGHVASCPNVHNTSDDREALLAAARRTLAAYDEG